MVGIKGQSPDELFGILRVGKAALVWSKQVVNPGR